MKILVDICIITLALLGCYLPDKQEQSVQDFFENLGRGYDVESDEIVSEGIFSNLKLYATEHLLLVDIKKTLYGLKDGSVSDVPPLPDYNEEYFNKFFLDLGSERSKELIKLFCRIKNEHNNKFKSKVYWLYLCISELYSSDIKYSGEQGYEYVVLMPRPTIDQQYFKVKKEIEKFKKKT
ncbi:P52 family lipoprotein (plasmid) [Borreliella yangtzensis]|uniref:P52 family lipoprotein n=1 Tax=Borreliella yangtzensis TaxID=683292 RepID=UPI003B220DF5